MKKSKSDLSPIIKEIDASIRAEKIALLTQLHEDYGDGLPPLQRLINIYVQEEVVPKQIDDKDKDKRMNHLNCRALTSNGCQCSRRFSTTSYLCHTHQKISDRAASEKKPFPLMEDTEDTANRISYE